jgi:hypoxanthine phosphoribosyltransferase
LGEEITRHYEGEPITVVGLMNGSIFFMADLIRTLPPTTRIECWRVQSYLGQRSTGRIQGLDSVLGDYAGRRILLIDDILDSGLTLTQVKRSLLSQNAKSVDICVLLKKRGHSSSPARCPMDRIQYPGTGLSSDTASTWITSIGACP